MNNMVWILMALVTVFAILEMLFVGSFFLAPFIGGGLVALLTAAFTDNILIIGVAFLIGSVVSYALLYPFAKKMNASSSAKTGAERLIAQKGLVLEDIVPFMSLGIVKVESEEWRANADYFIEAGATVEVLRLEGTKLIVKRAHEVVA